MTVDWTPLAAVAALNLAAAISPGPAFVLITPVSYTHLTLPTIYSV